MQFEVGQTVTLEQLIGTRFKRMTSATIYDDVVNVKKIGNGYATITYNENQRLSYPLSTEYVVTFSQGHELLVEYK